MKNSMPPLDGDVSASPMAPTDSLPPHVASIADRRSDPVCRAGLDPQKIRAFSRRTQVHGQVAYQVA